MQNPFGCLSAAAAAKSLQSCLTLCDPIDGSPPGCTIPGILPVRTLEWVAISFSNARKWKVKVKSLSLSRVWLLATPWTAADQAPPSLGFSRQEHWSGCHCFLCGCLSALAAAAAAVKSRQSCTTLCDPTDGSPLGSRPWDTPGKKTYHIPKFPDSLHIWNAFFCVLTFEWQVCLGIKFENIPSTFWRSVFAYSSVGESHGIIHCFNCGLFFFSWSF